MASALSRNDDGTLKWYQRSALFLAESTESAENFLTGRDRGPANAPDLCALCALCEKSAVDQPPYYGVTRKLRKYATVPGSIQSAIAPRPCSPVLTSFTISVGCA